MILLCCGPHLVECPCQEFPTLLAFCKLGTWNYLKRLFYVGNRIALYKWFTELLGRIIMDCSLHQCL